MRFYAENHIQTGKVYIANHLHTIPINNYTHMVQQVLELIASPTARGGKPEALRFVH